MGLKYIKGLAVLAKDSFIEVNMTSKGRYNLKSSIEAYYSLLDLYDETMQNVSDKGVIGCGFAPGRFEHQYEAITFYYKGVEVIYIFPWEKSKKNKTHSFIDTKYGYLFDDFYEYVKFRYAKENFDK